MPIPVLLDVDTGVDDAIALLLAVAHPHVELVAVTCVAGNVDVQQAAANTLAVLELCDAADTEVAADVFTAFSSAPRRPLVVGLDVTEQAGLRPEHVAALGTGPVADFVARAVAVKFELDQRVAHMHDPLALALALDATLGSTRPGTVAVELAGALTRVMTVLDWHGLWGREPNADVAVNIDAQRFLTELVDRISTLCRLDEGGKT